jgi:stage II sporulation protein D
MEAANMKQLALVLSGISVIILLIPTILVLPFYEGSSGTEPPKNQAKGVPKLEKSPVSVSVYRTAKQEVENIPLEEYVIGVVASEMPFYFEEEALKAQALAARTYIVKQMTGDTAVNSPKGSLVDDTQMFQVYKNNAELKKQWKEKYDQNIKKITDAVASTQGEILTYESKPISPSFFSTSNGYTENSEDYWQNEIAYLKSVKSTWDQKSPKFKDTKTFSVTEFEQKLGVKLPGGNTIGEITGRTPGKRVATAVINGKSLTGREIRERLGLKSSDFQWTRNNDTITITTKGFGHGIGMSQYGANFMAQEGKTAEEIVKYYYKGVKISSSDQFLNRYTAKK